MIYLNLLFFSFILFFSGCAHAPLYLPTFSSSKANCDPVWATHVPASVASDYIHAELLGKYADLLKENPSYIDKFFPSDSKIDAIGRNGIPIGLGTASIIGAFQDNNLGAVIGSAVTAGLDSVTNLRTEDRTQDRQDACMPRDSVLMYFVTEDVKMLIAKPGSDIPGWLENVELKPQEKKSPRPL